MRTALVGLGDIGLGAHLPALLRHPEVELVTLADPAQERREQAARMVREAMGNVAGNTALDVPGEATGTDDAATHAVPGTGSGSSQDGETTGTYSAAAGPADGTDDAVIRAVPRNGSGSSQDGETTGTYSAAAGPADGTDDAVIRAVPRNGSGSSQDGETTGTYSARTGGVITATAGRAAESGHVPTAAPPLADGGVAGGVRLVGGIEDVLADERVEAVVLATPPWVTAELVVRVVRAGKYVLAEKPVATSTAAAEVYDRLRPDETRRVQVGLTYRHDPAIERLAQWTRDGRLGGPLVVRAHIYDEARDPSSPGHTERIRRTLEHGMPVVHEGAHVFDWLATLLGTATPRLEDAWSVRTDAGLPAPNVVGARLRYGEHLALVEFGWLTDALPCTEVSVLGSRGHAVLDGFTFRLGLTTAKGQHVVEFPGERMTRCFDLQVARFVDLVAGRRTHPEPDLAAGRAALHTSEQVAVAAGGDR